MGRMHNPIFGPWRGPIAGRRVLTPAMYIEDAFQAFMSEWRAMNAGLADYEPRLILQESALDSLVAGKHGPVNEVRASFNVASDDSEDESEDTGLPLDVIVDSMPAHRMRRLTAMEILYIDASNKRERARIVALRREQKRNKRKLTPLPKKQAPLKPGAKRKSYSMWRFVAFEASFPWDYPEDGPAILKGDDGKPTIGTYTREPGDET